MLSRPEGREERFNSEDRQHSLQVIGQDLQAHLGRHVFQPSRPEVGRPIQSLSVPNTCSTVCRRVRIA